MERTRSRSPHVHGDSDRLARPGIGRVAARFAPGASALVLAAVALLFVRRYAVDWFYNDDIATLRWFAWADAGRLKLGDILDLWNNEHPVGAQFALMWAARWALGLDMKLFVALSAVVVALTAAVAARAAADARDPLPARLAAVAACFVLAFQPTQMEHLLWSFEIGWFLVDAVAVGNVALVERFGRRAAWAVFPLCAASSLCSAQGAFTFFAAAVHLALLPARRGASAGAGAPGDGRARPGLGRALPALLLGAGGLLALARLLWLPHPSASGPARPDHDLIGQGLFAVEILGGLFGTRDRALLLAGGTALTAAALTLLVLRRRGARPDRWRAAVVLLGFSALCVAAFAHGRHHLGLDWATASFHAAPLVMPFGLGLAILLGAAPSRPDLRRRDATAAVFAAVLLAAGVATASPYGLTRARLWAMDRGYARWATCSGAVPEAVAARASGIEHDLDGFRAARVLIRGMCSGSTGPLEAALVARPQPFDALAAGRPEVGAALDALWQHYATDLGLQLAFKPWRPDTPARLIAFARRDAEEGSKVDPARLAPHAGVYRALSP